MPILQIRANSISELGNQWDFCIGFAHVIFEKHYPYNLYSIDNNLLQFAKSRL